METEIVDGKKKPIAQLSIEARLLHMRLKEVKIGERISYEELKVVASADVRKGARSALRTARLIAQRDDQIVFECLKGEGLVRLDDKQIVATGDGALRRMGRLCRRSAKTMTCVNWGKLSNDDRIRHNTRLSMLGAVERMTRPAGIRKLEATVGTDQAGQLPVGRTLEAFRE